MALFTSIADRRTDGLDSEISRIAATHLTSPKSSIKIAGMETIIAAPAAPAQAPVPQTPLETAYIKFTQTQRGTSSHDQAWKELVDVLFVNAK